APRCQGPGALLIGDAGDLAAREVALHTTPVAPERRVAGVGEHAVAMVSARSSGSGRRQDPVRAGDPDTAGVGEPLEDPFEPFACVGGGQGWIALKYRAHWAAAEVVGDRGVEVGAEPQRCVG